MLGGGEKGEKGGVLNPQTSHANSGNPAASPLGTATAGRGGNRVSQPVRPVTQARSPPQQPRAAKVGDSGKCHGRRGQADQVSGRTRWHGGHGLNPEQSLSAKPRASVRLRQVQAPWEQYTSLFPPFFVLFMNLLRIIFNCTLR